MRPWIALGIALVCVAPTAARASGGADTAAATELFNAGRDLMKAGDYAAACPKLAESARLEPTVGALAKLAECEEHERRLVSAYGRWQQALNLARAIGDPRAVDVEHEVARLEGTVPKLRVLAAGALPADTVIRVDDVELRAASLGVSLAVEPGKHTIQAAAPRKIAWSTTVETAADGGTASVTIPVLEDAAPVTPTPISAPLPPPPAVEPPPGGGAHAPWSTVGLVAAAAGVGALAAGSVFGIVALKQRDEAGCTDNLCPDFGNADKLRTAKASANWATGLFITGGVLVAGGGSLWWISRPHGPSGVTAVVTPGGLAGSF